VVQGEEVLEVDAAHLEAGVVLVLQGVAVALAPPEVGAALVASREGGVVASREVEEEDSHEVEVVAVEEALADVDVVDRSLRELAGVTASIDLRIPRSLTALRGLDWAIM
jgi:hypothetical protein